MAYLGLAFILAIAYFIEWLEDRADKKQTSKVEEIHKDIYSLIDEHYSGFEARERKAQADAMIGAVYKDNRRDYRPQNIKMVTTAEERKKRIKAELDGTADDTELIRAQLLDALNLNLEYDSDDDWYYEEHTEEEKREHLIKYFIREVGDSREDAEKHADNFFKFAKEL